MSFSKLNQQASLFLKIYYVSILTVSILKKPRSVGQPWKADYGGKGVLWYCLNSAMADGRQNINYTIMVSKHSTELY